jgi:hypothetical protein
MRGNIRAGKLKNNTGIERASFITKCSTQKP